MAAIFYRNAVVHIATFSGGEIYFRIGLGLFHIIAANNAAEIIGERKPL